MLYRSTNEEKSITPEPVSASYRSRGQINSCHPYTEAAASAPSSRNPAANRPARPTPAARITRVTRTVGIAAPTITAARTVSA